MIVSLYDLSGASAEPKLYIRDHFGNGFSQWRTTLHCNVGSDWLIPYTERSLMSSLNIMTSLCQLIVAPWRHVATSIWVNIGSCNDFVPDGSNQAITWTNIDLSPVRSIDIHPWWRHEMEAFSALLAICAGNSPVPGEFHTQRPVTRSFDVYFDLRLNKRLCKQWRGWWFETLLCPLWRHSNAEDNFARDATAINH